MSRHHISLLAATLGIIVCGGSCSPSSQRTIPYVSDRPIADRLLPGDKEVLIQMELSDQKAGSGPDESFDQEIQRLRRGEIVALVRVTAAAGEIADRGTWVRTTVSADVDRLVKAQEGRALDPSIKFTYSAGTAHIGNVVVTTGKFPRFVEGEPYLVFLRIQRGTSASLVWDGIAFRVDAHGVLQRVSSSDGGEQSFRTNLVGKSVSEVMEALAP
jgi:hypothetical protein